MFFAVSFCAEARQDLAPKAAGDFFHTVLAQNHEEKTTPKATPERYSKGNELKTRVAWGRIEAAKHRYAIKS